MSKVSRPSLRHFSAGFVASAFFLFALETSANAWWWSKGAEPKADIAGTARVIDGDTIDIAGERIRLEGIDAPENAQTCNDASGGSYNCGASSAKALEAMVRGRDITCKRVGHDKYNRVLGICSTDGHEINKAMVAGGYAWAFVKYSQSYVAAEAEARAAHVGLWKGTAKEAPWDFREHRWASAEPSAPQGCAIKGNITNHGSIYHMPWSPWYNKVKIEESKGERWFCSESEALAAGWRPSQAH